MSDKATVKVATPTAFAVAGTSNPYPLPRGPVTFQGVAITTNTGASSVIVGAATVQVSNDTTNWLALGTLTSTGSGTGAADGFACVAPWAVARIVVTTLTTGIAATFTPTIGM